MMREPAPTGEAGLGREQGRLAGARAKEPTAASAGVLANGMETKERLRDDAGGQKDDSGQAEAARQRQRNPRARAGAREAGRGGPGGSQAGGARRAWKREPDAISDGDGLDAGRATRCEDAGEPGGRAKDSEPGRGNPLTGYLIDASSAAGDDDARGRSQDDTQRPAAGLGRTPGAGDAPTTEAALRSCTSELGTDGGMAARFKTR